MNLFDLFAERVAAQPDHLACIGPRPDTRISYRQLLESVEAAAQALRRAGVRPKQCVGLHCPSDVDYIVWAYAIWACQATIVPIAVELTREEKVDICESIDLVGVITGARQSAIFKTAEAAGETRLQGQMVYVARGEDRPRPPGLDTINAAFVRFTSGTTGLSKGVVLSHETVRDRIHAANDALNVGPTDLVLWLLSMSYHFTVSIVAYLSFGATIVLCSDHFGSTMVETAAREKVTFMYGSPQHFRAMASDHSDTALPALRLAISTASALQQETAGRFEQRFGLPVSQAYGIIEIGLPCINMLGETLKPGSVGRPLPAYELRLSDIGLPGGLKAIEVRGKGLLDAYYSPWQTADTIMHDGWFETGDLGTLDADGFLYILGRSKEIISVGGMKFFPQEVEAVLEQHESVRQAYVLAEPHDRLGEVPYGLVQLKPGREAPPGEELRAYCAERLSAFKVPQRIEYVSELPRTASGKRLRRMTAHAASPQPGNTSR